MVRMFQGFNWNAYVNWDVRTLPSVVFFGMGLLVLKNLPRVFILEIPAGNFKFSRKIHLVAQKVLVRGHPKVAHAINNYTIKDSWHNN